MSSSGAASSTRAPGRRRTWWRRSRSVARRGLVTSFRFPPEKLRSPKKWKSSENLWAREAWQRNARSEAIFRGDCSSDCSHLHAFPVYCCAASPSWHVPALATCFRDSPCSCRPPSVTRAFERRHGKIARLVRDERPRRMGRGRRTFRKFVALGRAKVQKKFAERRLRNLWQGQLRVSRMRCVLSTH